MELHTDRCTDFFEWRYVNNLPTGQNLESDKARNHKKILHLSLIVQNFIPPVWRGILLSIHALTFAMKSIKRMLEFQDNTAVLQKEKNC